MAKHGPLHARTTRTLDLGNLGTTTRLGEAGGSHARTTDDDDRRPGKDLRCGCHRLLARAVTAGVELRCSRCKTTQILSWATVHKLEAEALAGSV
jgi:phage FluMu protein Com